MAKLIPGPATAHHTISIAIAGIYYDITYKFNTRDNGGAGRWRITVGYTDGETFIRGVKVMEGQLLLGRFALPDFEHGDIWVYSEEGPDDEGITGRDNLGSGKLYQLMYMSNEELEEIGEVYRGL